MGFKNGEIVCITNYGGEITVTNNGSSTATGVQVTFTTPPGLSLNVDTAAESTLTFTVQPSDTETVIIGSKTYTFQTVLTDVDGNVLIGATLADSISNLINAINLTGTPGTDYALSMTIHPDVTGSEDTGSVADITAKVAGTAGNSIATTTTVTGATWTGATMSGGIDGPTISQGTFAGNTWDVVSLAMATSATITTCYTITDSTLLQYPITYEVTQTAPEQTLNNNSGTRLIAFLSCSEIEDCLDTTSPLSIGDVSAAGNSSVLTVDDSTETITATVANLTQVSTTGAFTPPVMTATQASALTPADGMILYVSDTNGTFTDIGHWGYMNATWTFLGFSAASAVTSVFSRTGAVTAQANDYTWAQIDKTVSDLADITTKSHTSLTDIGVNTHAQIDTHIADATIHETAANLRDRATHTGTQLASTVSDFTAAAETAIFTVANFVDSSKINFTVTPGASVTATTIDGAIDHNSLLNYVANQHIDWTAASDNFATSGTITGSSGAIDFGSATSLEIPNGAAPVVNAAGEIAIDTTITDYTGLIKYHDGLEELTVVALPTANLSTTDGDVIAYNAANNEFEMVANAGSGTDPNAIHDNISGEIVLITEKATPLAADLFVIESNADANAKRRLTYANLQSNLSITESQISDLGSYLTDASVDTLTNKTINTASNTITVVEADISDLQSYLLNIVEDTTPQLGGDLDTNGNSVVISTGEGIRTGTTDTNTALLQAYDVDGTAYVTFATLTAGNTPTFDLSASTTIAGNTILDDTYTGDTGLVTTGTISTGTWQATAVGVPYGGTGQTSFVNGELLIGNTTGNTLTKATLTKGDGVTITNGTGTITIETDVNGLTSESTVDGAADYLMLYDDTVSALRKVLPNDLPIAPFGVTTSAAGNYSVLATDKVILKTGITGGGDTVTLPSTGVVQGQVFYVKDGTGTAGTNNITVDVTGALSTIDGSGTYVMNVNYESVAFIAGPSQYHVLTAYLE